LADDLILRVLQGLGLAIIHPLPTNGKSVSPGESGNPTIGQFNSKRREGQIMTLLELQTRVGADGVLHLTVPLGGSEANQEVTVTIKTPVPAFNPGVSPEKWRAKMLEIAGSISDPTFTAPGEQGLLALDDITL
jgi:hypothetical protein